MFPLGALLAKRGVTSVYRAAQDTFCLVLPVATFDALIAPPPYSRTSARGGSPSAGPVARAAAGRVRGDRHRTARTVDKPLGSLLRQAPVVCGPDTPVSEVLAAMEKRRIGSMPIVDAESKPIGIFTRQDVIGRIVLPQRPLAVPVRDVMTRRRSRCPPRRPPAMRRW